MTTMELPMTITEHELTIPQPLRSSGSGLEKPMEEKTKIDVRNFDF